MPAIAVPLREDQAQVAGAVLARAFQEDPLWQFVLPEAAERAALLPAFFVATTAYGLSHGRVDTTPATEGVAIWIPPAVDGDSAGDPEAAEYGPVGDRFDAAAAARFTAMTRYYQILRRRWVPEPHWYLACLGVDPSRQRTGIGGALLRSVLERADSAAIGCYLETENEANLPFYRGQGFEVIEKGTLPGGGPACWTMKRQPSVEK